MVTLLASLFVFGLLIASHELGHFIVAKLSGVKVLEFSLGMGPKFVGFRRNETDYSIRILPIGGYVKMLGEEGESSDPRAFCNQSPWKRMPIIVAGAFMNFLIAIILFSISFTNTGFEKPVVSEVQPNSPAYNAGIKENDKILKVDDKKISTWPEFVMYVQENGNRPLNIWVDRNGNITSFKVNPMLDKESGKYKIGIYGTLVESGNFLESLKQSLIETTSSIKLMWEWLGRAFTGKASLKDVGGPVAIVQMSGQAARLGISTLLYFAGFLSINLGVINLLPFPALDGGWVIILLIEGITGRKIDENKIGFVNMIGFTLLMILAAVVIVKDFMTIM
ncbi:regulator of sigma E protease [Fonticella tunisiensis]|uniref:Zinc metalloprotease n=1 Tax=Fonticella tunisiensis TaxID=1096341 RepID=A0A4R7KSC0_9CLOT|nr:regulator of sigma E protease [Fonticella tunisiensis]